MVEAAASGGFELLERDIAPAIEAQSPAAEITELIRGYTPDYDLSVDAYAVNADPELARRLGALVYRLRIGPRHGRPVRTLNVSVQDLRRIIAYQNRKQRTRMLFAYAEAEARNLAVVGASNGDELATGIVVKYGDDAADLCPIADLSKPEVYGLAEALGVPARIVTRPPTRTRWSRRRRTTTTPSRPARSGRSPV